MCAEYILKSSAGVPCVFSISIGPPSALVRCRNAPVVAELLNGSPVTLLAPPKGVFCVSFVTLVIVTALPLDSVKRN